jgi:rod shape-determining protein MreD
LQTSASPYVKISGVHPDLVLIIVTGWGLLRGNPEGLIWAVIGGLSLDLLSAAPFGLFTLTLLLVGLLTNFVHGRTFGSSIVLPISLIFPLSLLFNFLPLLILYLLGHPTDWTAAFSNIFFPVAVFNTGLMLLIFPLLYLLNRWLNPQRLSF